MVSPVTQRPRHIGESPGNGQHGARRTGASLLLGGGMDRRWDGPPAKENIPGNLVIVSKLWHILKLVADISFSEMN